MSAWYSIEGEDERHECDWVSTESEHGTTLAETCASHYHDRSIRLLWWPITLTLYESESGPAIGKYKVAKTEVPTYYAREA